jgi:dTDP-4-dehydrorhamnose reductase
MATASNRLLISPDGMLGRAFESLLTERGVEHETLVYPAFDITDRGAVESSVADQFDLVINCSAWTDVDSAEDREEEADAVNAVGVGYLADRCREIGALLVHFSTDYVFSGNARAPYRVDEARNPVNAYGRSKAKGEVRLEESQCRFLLLRTSWLYAAWGNNFVRTIARLALEKESLRVVDDQIGRPSSAFHVAATALALVEAGQTGIFHATDGGTCSWFELARAIVASANPTCRVEPCTSDEYPRPASRPAYSVLDLQPTEAALGRPMPHWRENLADVMAAF